MSGNLALVRPALENAVSLGTAVSLDRAGVAIFDSSCAVMHQYGQRILSMVSAGRHLCASYMLLLNC